jgi:hypothetical protein
VIPQWSPEEKTIADVSLRPADLLARAGNRAGTAGLSPPAAAGSQTPAD